MPKTELAIRKRAKHTRSNLGCGTCRIRRVRCDRTHPVCQRCSSTGRVCDGYPTQQAASTPSPQASTENNGQLIARRTASLPIAPRISSSLQTSFPESLSDEETRAFHHFRQSTAADLAGEFATDFWGRLVLQVGHREPCVRHLTIAISSLHASLVKDGFSTSLYPILPAEDLRRRAVAQYTKALHLFNQHIISKQGSSFDVTMLCSLLCMTFEWLRTNHNAALVHLRSILRLVHEWHETSTGSTGRSTGNQTSYWSPSGHLIRTTLFPMLRRTMMEVRSIVNADDMVFPAIEPETSDPDTFSSVVEARDSLFVILGDLYDFFVSLGPAKPKIRSRQQTSAQKSLSPQARWDLWSTRLKRFLAESATQQNLAASLTLRIWQKTTGIMLAVKDVQEEVVFDIFTDTFETIVDLSTELYSLPRSGLSADMSIVAVLYFVATKCRHPVIRRRALGLLTAAPRREGIWQSEGAAKVATEIMEIEEGFVEGEVTKETDLKGIARVSHAVVDLGGEDTTWTIRTVMSGGETWHRGLHPPFGMEN
ncbi:unnamed protein product [Clonostachys rosea]|uniref:Zn(2)-C6 fungal-type domain-containing protein n=1 Tax=Bionectria ochroleuca TaxID=29856 RepID=A0ABY6U007_BIOOC|nr:unnamed protein product [Clonostachys rosea]